MNIKICGGGRDLDDDELDNMEEAMEAFSEALPSICSYKQTNKQTP
jgi:hypothetical protein